MEQAANSKRIERIEKDINILFARTNSSAIAQATINEKLNSMMVTLGELKNGLMRLQEKPAQKWDKLVIAVITAISTTVTGFLIGKLI